MGTVKEYATKGDLRITKLDLQKEYATKGELRIAKLDLQIEIEKNRTEIVRSQQAMMKLMLCTTLALDGLMFLAWLFVSQMHFFSTP